MTESTSSFALEFGEHQAEAELRLPEGVVSLTHLDKVFWPDEGYTKGDLLQYYHSVAPIIVPYLQDRPLVLRRYPRGVGKSALYQHEIDVIPPFVRTTRLESELGRLMDFTVCDNEATLLYLANAGAIAQHPWHSRVADLERPDYMVFDLDPEQDDYMVVCRVALALKEVLDRLGLSAVAKTSGATGMHVVVPLDPVYDYDTVADVAERITLVTQRENPDLVTLERHAPLRRAGRVYLDHQQNARGRALVAAYSARARSGATVSAPLDWAEVRRGVEPRMFTIKTMVRRLQARGDLFAPVLASGQRLEYPMAELAKFPHLKRGPQHLHAQ